MPSDAVANGTITAVSQTVVLDTTGRSSADIVLSGTWVGTIQLEFLPDNGTTWYALPASAIVTPPTADVTSATGNGVWKANVAAFPQIRVRASAWTSGSATVRLEASEAARGGGSGVATVTSSVTPLTTETVTRVANSLTNVTLVAANASRRSLKVFNDGTAGNLFLKHGATASLTSFTVKLAPGQWYEMPQPAYVGIIDGIWDAAGSAAQITEGA